MLVLKSGNLLILTTSHFVLFSEHLFDIRKSPTQIQLLLCLADSVYTSYILTTSLVNLLSDLDAERIDHFISVGMHDYTPTADALDKEVLNVVNECLELVKAHVAQQR